MSLGDWKFAFPQYELSPTKYVSEPTSLATTPANVPRDVVCQVPAAYVLPYGRVIYSCYFEEGSHASMTFRLQTLTALNAWQNSYMFRIVGGGQAKVRNYVAGGTVFNYDFAWTPALNTWHKLRCTWWLGLQGGVTPALACQLEVWEGGAWVSKGIGYDTVNRWADSNINAVGHYLHRTTDVQYIDDTEIYGPC